MKVFGVDFADRYGEQSDNDWRDRMFEELQDHMPRMQRDHSTHAEFWRWFQGEADSLVQGASASKRPRLCERINSLLEKAGLEDRYHS